MNIDYMVSVLPKLLAKVPLILYIATISFSLALLLASFLAYIRIKKVPLLDQLVQGFVSFGRSVPGLIHIFIIYYGLPALFGLVRIDINHISKTTFAILALVCYQGTSLTEVLRPAYLAIPRSQYEAAISIGMTDRQANRRVIVPQMLPIILPSLGNAAIDLVKYTSLLFLIGLIDLMGQADILVSNTYGVYQLEIYLLVGAIYWAISLLISQIFKRFESKVSAHLI